MASLAGTGAQWAGWNNAGVLNATTAGGALGAWICGENPISGAMQGYSIGALNHTWDDEDRAYYLQPAEPIYMELMPWQMPGNDYCISYSNDVGFVGTGIDFANWKWSALSIHTKSKLTWETWKFTRDHLGYRIKTPKAEIYRKVIPQKLKSTSKVLGVATLGLNAFENYEDISNNKRVGIGNASDIGITLLSILWRKYGLYCGIAYLGADYVTYELTGMSLRDQMNLRFSINW